MPGEGEGGYFANGNENGNGPPVLGMILGKLALLISSKVDLSGCRPVGRRFRLPARQPGGRAGPSDETLPRRPPTE